MHYGILNRAISVPLLALALVLSGCDGVTDPELPASVEKLAGNDQLTGPGESLPQALVVQVVSDRGQAMEGVEVTWTVERGGGSVDPATDFTDAEGRAETSWTLGPEEGTQEVSAEIPGLEPTRFVATAGECPAARTFSLEVGESMRLTGPQASAFCVEGAASGAEFVAVGFHGAPATQEANLEFRPHNTAPLSGPPLPAMAGPQAAPLHLDRGGLRDAGRPEVNHRLHMELLRRTETELGPRIRLGRTSGNAPPETSAATAPASVPSVGELMTFNTQTESACEDPVHRTGRVEVVGETVIIVADTLNPTPTFTQADYQRFANAFDQEVRPLTDALFGAPADIDDNDRVIAFFTQEVNRLAASDGGEGVVLGFFFARDLFPRTTACETSNEAEMFYMRVPDEEGEVGSEQTIEQVRRFTVATMAHEHQHLVNASRRLFVHEAPHFEVLWLNEALSHITEEFLFYDRSGLSSGMNLEVDDLLDAGDAAREAFNEIQIINMLRVAEYMQNPHRSSLYDTEDGAAMRGAAWHFLRYALDRDGDDTGRFSELVNTTSRGMDNVEEVFGVDARSWMRDWSVTLYADDRVPGISDAFTEPSWNHRDFYSRLQSDGQPAFPEFPIATVDLEDGGPRSLTLKGGGSVYLRFMAEPGATPGIRTEAGNGSIPDVFSLTILRTK